MGEPTAWLDSKLVHELLELAAELNQQGLTVMMSTGGRVLVAGFLAGSFEGMDERLDIAGRRALNDSSQERAADDDPIRTGPHRVFHLTRRGHSEASGDGKRPRGPLGPPHQF